MDAFDLSEMDTALNELEKIFNKEEKNIDNIHVRIPEVIHLIFYLIKIV